MHKVFSKNEAGKDYIVGDIHGCFSRLATHLEFIGFDEAVDRLFCVGDLVDRGPDSELALDWLAMPWFYCVRGNHEQMAIDHVGGFSDRNNYIANGGAWFLGMTKPEQALFADAFGALPICITLETERGNVGIVHADCPLDDWHELITHLQGEDAEAVGLMCMWSRDRISSKDNTVIKGVIHVVCGHTPVTRPCQFGNVMYIDTGAVFPGHDFTILRTDTMTPVLIKSQAD